MIVQDDRGSLLTKGSLYNHFYRADARHEISCRKARIFVSQSVQSGSLWMAMAELLQCMTIYCGDKNYRKYNDFFIDKAPGMV